MKTLICTALDNIAWVLAGGNQMNEHPSWRNQQFVPLFERTNPIWWLLGIVALPIYLILSAVIIAVYIGSQFVGEVIDGTCKH